MGKVVLVLPPWHQGKHGEEGIGLSAKVHAYLNSILPKWMKGN